MKYTNNKAITLIELLVSAYILLIGICGILSLFVKMMTSTNSAWDITTATIHAESILEEMQNKSSLSDIISTDWNEWALKQNLITLPQEKFKITYKDLDSNLLDIQVINEWQRKSTTQHIILNTKLSK